MTPRQEARKIKRKKSLELWEKGLTAKMIAERLGMGRNTVTTWLKSFGITTEELRDRSAWRIGK